MKKHLPDPNKVNVNVTTEGALERVGEELAARRAALVRALRLDKVLVATRVDVVREGDRLLVAREEKADLRRGQRHVNTSASKSNSEVPAAAFLQAHEPCLDRTHLAECCEL